MKSTIYATITSLLLILLASCGGNSSKNQNTTKVSSTKELAATKEQLQNILNTLNTLESAHYRLSTNKGDIFYEDFMLDKNNHQLGIQFITTDDNYFPYNGYINSTAFSRTGSDLMFTDYETLVIPTLLSLQRILKYAIETPGLNLTYTKDADGESYKLSFGYTQVDFSYAKIQFEPRKTSQLNFYTLILNDDGLIEKVMHPYGYYTIEYLSVNNDTPLLVQGIDKYTILDAPPSPYLGYKEYIKDKDNRRVDSALIAHAFKETLEGEDFAIVEDTSTYNTIAYLASAYNYMRFLKEEIFGENYTNASPQENVRFYGPRNLIYGLIDIYINLSDRSAENITSFYRQNKNSFYTAITKPLFYNYRLDKEVLMCKMAYDDIFSANDHQIVLDNIRSSINSYEDENYSLSISDAMPFFEEIMLSDWQRYANRNEDAVYWYWFWLRRYEEGNATAVHNILQEVMEHYL